MTAGITIVKPGPATADIIRVKANATEIFIRRDMGRKCALFYVFMEHVGRSPELTQLLASTPGYPDMLREIDLARTVVEWLARAVSGLDSGTMELVAIKVDEPPGPGETIAGQIGFGVWPKGQLIAQHGEPTTLEWILIPVLVLIAVTVAVTGAFMLNMYSVGKKAGEQSDYLRDQTERLIQKKIAEAPAGDRAGLMRAFEDAKRAAESAANQGGKGWLSSIGSGLADLATAAVNTTTSLVASAESWLPWVLGGWLVVNVLGSVATIFGGRGRRCCD